MATLELRASCRCLIRAEVGRFRDKAGRHRNGCLGCARSSTAVRRMTARVASWNLPLAEFAHDIRRGSNRASRFT
jgi:hypothetical protein